MKMIRIADGTLSSFDRQNGRQPTFREKIEIAKLLDTLSVDVIETPGIANPAADAVLLKTIASVARFSVVSVPVGTTGEAVQRAWEMIAGARKPRLRVALPVSTLQMEYTLRKKPAEVLALIGELVSRASGLCADVEFSALDATRAEDEFLYQAVGAAVRAGAKTISLCDSAGTMLPDEFGAFIKNLYCHVPEMYDLTLGVECADTLNMAVACAFQAVRAGAGLIKTAVSGTDLPGLCQMVNLLNARGDACLVGCGVSGTEIGRCAAQIQALSTGEGAAFTGKDGFTQSQDTLALSAEADIAAVSRAVRLLGYDLSDEDMAKVYESFAQLAGRKTVASRELEAIVANVALQVPPTFKLVSYVVNSGNIISATAHIVLDKAGQRVSGLSLGDGPIDAALMAIEKIIGHHYELDDFQLQSVTSGREALGEAIVKLRDDGHLYSGRGLSTDIVGASIRAYLNALNKIVYRENAL